MALTHIPPLLITGKNGQLAQKLQGILTFYELPYVTFGKEEMDITDRKQVIKTIQQWRPSIIIHAAALTKVDEGETDFHRMANINIHGTKNLLDAAEKTESSFMYVSSDFVFNGRKNSPYMITDTPSPLNQYGYSKWLGEEYVRRHSNPWWIVRTSSLFGGKESFVDTIVKKASKREKIEVVEDQVSSPTYVGDLAKTMIYLLEKESGVYHVTNQGESSKYTLAKYIYSIYGISNKNITSITSKQWQSPAERPRYSVLQCNITEKEYVPRHWKAALEDYLRGLG